MVVLSDGRDIEGAEPSPLDGNAGIVEQLLRIGRAEVPLALSEHHGYHVHGYLIHEAERECLASDVPGADRDHTVTCSLLRVLYGGDDVLDERDIGLRMPTLRLRSVGHHDEMLTGRRLGLPAVGQVEQVPPLDRGADAAPERADVLVGSTADSKSGVTVLARLVGDGHVVASHWPSSSGSHPPSTAPAKHATTWTSDSSCIPEHPTERSAKASWNGYVARLEAAKGCGMVDRGRVMLSVTQGGRASSSPGR